MAHETSPDGGIDADKPILLNGGTVSAFGTRNDAAGSESAQPYMELSFASTLPVGSVVTVTDADGKEVWSGTTQKRCQAITLTTPGLALDTVYHVYVDGVLQCYSSTGSMGFPGGMGEMPSGMDMGFMPQMPSGGFGGGSGGWPDFSCGNFSGGGFPGGNMPSGFPG